MLHLPENDIHLIQTQLNQGKRLIVGLCASWCNNCEEWRTSFSELPEKYAEHCFVWLDIDDHPDMVAEVDLDVLPVLLVQEGENIHFLGPVRPEIEVTERLIQSHHAMADVIEPGIRDFLLENYLG